MMDDIMNAYGGRFLIAALGVFLALAVLVVVLWILKNRAPSPFVRGGRNRQPRLQVLDAAAVDARRRLVLVRRDNIEHLILIGGPSDIVIESGIGEPKTYLAGELATQAALAARQPEQLAASPLTVTDQQQTEQQIAPRALAPEAPAQPIIPPAPAEKAQKPVPSVKPQEPRPAAQATAPVKAEPRPAASPRAPEPPAATAVAKAEAAVARTTPSVEADPVVREAAVPPVAAPEVTAQPPQKPEASRNEPVKAEPAPPAPEAAKTEVQPEPVAAPLKSEDASAILDAARDRVLTPKVQPFPPERFAARPAAPEPQARPEPDDAKLRSEFEKILDAQMQTEADITPPRPARPTIEPPVARAVPPIRPPQPAGQSTVEKEKPADGNLQDEIARIFGEMNATKN
ncbi:flagellar biosynthetic protein FliO [Rhizobium paknamense]|uniref:Flagellar biogenesis protein FliO n=1 Tax=Rhizobium paknamense TaxID=1206817 RepID=A0ABU0I9D6_9HYPH|nr:flagellar biosynthetic protein FliO [Rhizobium paknamense]MDQ0453834.1 flagellar biogenesis protein FliO [Rhizobium paknamense]